MEQNKKSIIQPSKFAKSLKTLVQFFGMYFGFAALVILFTLPTKLIWSVVYFLWNLI